MRSLVVNGLAYRSSGEVLLAREGYGLHLWNFPGGGVEEGESLSAALCREVAEETALTADVTGLVALRERPDQIIFVFAIDVTGEMERPNTGEIDELAWMPVDLALGNPDVYGFAKRVLKMQSRHALTTSRDIGPDGRHWNLSCPEPSG